MTAGRGLTADDFRPLGVGGFGDGGNAYAHTMAWFRDRLYVGATRHNLALLGMYDRSSLSPWPVWAPPDVYDLDLRGRVLELDLRTSTARWALVAPLVQGEGGRVVPRDIGYRGMTVVESFREPGGALYLTTWSPRRAQRPALLLRSPDGTDFSPLSALDAVKGASAFRALVAAGDALYCAPTARSGGHTNVVGDASVLVSLGLGREPWRTSNTPGFGERTNATIFELAVWEDQLWASTLNPTHGFELWRRPLGEAGDWSRVLVDGAYRGNLNECGLSLLPFRDALYVGTGIQHGGRDRMNAIGPAGAEVLRVHPDGSWDLLVGEPRRTPAGSKEPLSGLGPGFDDVFNGYVWRMAVHDGWLYASTFNSAVMLPYLSLTGVAPSVRAVVERVGRDAIVNSEGGFDLWRTADGVHWHAVSRNGFGNPYNFGARSLVSTPYGLAVGTANPFGPSVAKRNGAGWGYVDNPRGGLEVWLGRAVGTEVPCASP
jgi:hypothetical protein